MGDELDAVSLSIAIWFRFELQDVHLDLKDLGDIFESLECLGDLEEAHCGVVASKKYPLKLSLTHTYLLAEF